MRIHSTRKSVVDWSLPSRYAAVEPAHVLPGEEYRLGALLQRSGDITAEQAEHTARTQAGSGARFGETVVALGFADQAAVDRALAAQFDFAIAHPTLTALDPSLVVAQGGRDRASELIRRLRTRLANRLVEVEQPIVLITSLSGKVGRRVIASNLAVAFAQAGTRTLLIDADLRTPTLHRLFGAVNPAGLSTLLAAREAPNMAFEVAEIPGLTFVPAGPTPPNPAELLSRLPAVLPKVCDHAGAELVLINAPPIDAHDDAFSLAAVAPYALFVARRNYTRSDRLAAAARRFAAIGCVITGSVLNVS